MNVRRIIGDIFILLGVIAILAFFQAIERLPTGTATVIAFSIAGALWAVYFHLGFREKKRVSPQFNQYIQSPQSHQSPRLFDQDEPPAKPLDGAEIYRQTAALIGEPKKDLDK